MRVPPAVNNELQRYAKRVRTGRWKWSLATPFVDDRMKLPVLLEEVGEIGSAIKKGDRENLKEEVAQVAAGALAWLSALEEEHGPTRERKRGS